MGNSAVPRVAAGAPVSRFFRFPDLQHPPALVSYLGERNIAIFSTDIDSSTQDTEARSSREVGDDQDGKHGKGIILMHDFQHATAEALPELIRQLKAGGYKVVHMVPRQPLTTFPNTTRWSPTRTNYRRTIRGPRPTPCAPSGLAC